MYTNKFVINNIINLKIISFMNDLVKGTLLLAGGIVIGAAAALLLAPQTGEETRKQIIDLAEEAKKRTADYCEKVKKDIAAAIEEARAEEKPAEA